MQVWSTLIEKYGLYYAKKVKNSNFQYFSGNNPGVTGRISLIIELIRDLVPINTSCKFSPDWLRNVVSIALTRKELMDTRTTDELPWHKPLWPLASGAKNHLNQLWTPLTLWKRQSYTTFAHAPNNNRNNFFFNPLLSGGLFHPYILGESICHLRGIRCNALDLFGSRQK